MAKVIFLHLSVILFTGWGSASVHTGMPTPPGPDPPGADTPPDHTPRTTPPGADTPPDQYSPGPHRPEPPPWDQTPPGPDPPGPDPPGPDPPWEADSGIQSTSGRYASYWNAFLLVISLASPYSNRESESLNKTNRLTFSMWNRLNLYQFKLCNCKQYRDVPGPSLETFQYL